MQLKKCTKCLEFKNFELFDKNKCKKDGLNNHCKNCRKLYRLNNSENIKESNLKYYLKNKKNLHLKSKKWSEENRKQSNLIKYNYYKNNRELYNLRKVKKYKDNKLFNLKERLKSRTCFIFKNKKYNKNTSTEKLLGISYYDLIIYIENKFLLNMNWENRNLWHVDHIIPLSSAKTEEELVKLCHYTNLQPLWAEDNLKKSNKIYYAA